MVDAPTLETLQVGLDTDLVDTFVVGPGNVLKLNGWCYHPWQRIRALHVIADGAAHPVHMRGIVTLDIFKVHAPERDHTGTSLNSGFYALVPFSRVDVPTRRQPHSARHARRRIHLRGSAGPHPIASVYFAGRRHRFSRHVCTPSGAAPCHLYGNL